MRETTGDLFTFRGPNSIVVIPVNGMVKTGKPIAIMGAGVAKQAAHVWPLLPRMLGTQILKNGNVVHKFKIKTNSFEEWVVTFPTKEDWMNLSDLNLIERSARALAAWVDILPEGVTIYLPRVGCGHGKKTWKEVKPILEKYFNNRFVVVHPDGE